jgi:hypothetical protein
MKFEHQYDESSPKIVIELDKDSRFSDVLDAFVRFSTAVTYNESTIEECIIALADEYRHCNEDTISGSNIYTTTFHNGKLINVQHTDGCIIGL